MISRVTDNANLSLLGVPPKDLIDEVARALREAGLNVDECFKRACAVTNEWTYTEGHPDVRSRFAPKWVSEFHIPVKMRSLAEILDPQPRASAVIHKVLDWIERRDSFVLKPSGL